MAMSYPSIPPPRTTNCYRVNINKGKGNVYIIKHLSVNWSIACEGIITIRHIVQVHNFMSWLTLQNKVGIGKQYQSKSNACCRIHKTTTLHPKHFQTQMASHLYNHHMHILFIPGWVGSIKSTFKRESHMIQRHMSTCKKEQPTGEVKHHTQKVAHIQRYMHGHKLLKRPNYEFSSVE